MTYHLRDCGAKDCQPCRDRAIRATCPVPRDIPERGDEHDMHGANPYQYQRGFWRDNTNHDRRDRQR